MLLSYFIKRLVFAVFTLWLVSLLMFGLSTCTPVHPVERLFEQEQFGKQEYHLRAADFRTKAAMLGLDKPIFYFAVQPAYYPDTTYRIFPPELREQICTLADQTAQAGVAADWFSLVHTADAALSDSSDQATRNALSALATETDLSAIGQLLQNWQIAPTSESLALKNTLQSAYLNLQQTASASKWYQRLPKLSWYGMDNQYHHWLGRVLSGDFGKSFKNRLPVSDVLSMRLKRSVAIGSISILLAFLVAVPLGAMSMHTPASGLERGIGVRTALFLYAIPVFWLGSLLILCFATPFFGLQLFRFGCGSASNTSIWVWLSESASCLVLPVVTMSVHLATAIYLQMRTAMHEVMQKEYIRTARLKGLTERQVLWRHAVPNALFPIITMLGGVFSFVVAGSVVIEYLFDIPGMGAAFVDAFSSRDYPVLFAILMLYAAAIVLGNLFADVLYALFDPRVRYV